MKKKETTEKANIAIKIHVPDKVSDSTKQQKINRLYDILKPKTDKSA